MKDIRKHYANTARKMQQQTCFVETPENVSVWKKPCTLFLDQAQHAGYCIFDADSKLVLSGVMSRTSTDSVKDFVHDFIAELEILCVEYGVSKIYFEETYIPTQGGQYSLGTVESLNYVKHKIEDISYNTQNAVETLGIPNKTWKSTLARPETFKPTKNKKEEKAQVQKFVSKIYPLVAMISDDECDAIGMGIAVMIKNPRRENRYNLTTFKKNLPIFVEFFNNDVDLSDLGMSKQKVRFSRPFGLGGLHELPINLRGDCYKDIRQFLSHKDAVVYLKISRNYKNWGTIILNENIAIDDITSEDKSFILMASRKRRL